MTQTREAPRHGIDRSKLEPTCLCGEPAGVCPRCDTVVVCDDARCPECNYNLHREDV